MRRETPFLAAAACTYLLSWFLPVLDNYVGWQAFRVALSSIWPYQSFRAGSYVAVLNVLSALTNIVFALSFAVLTTRLHVRRTLLVCVLVAAIALNLRWFILSLDNSQTALRIGYYLWIFSFASLAIGAYFRPRQKAA